MSASKSRDWAGRYRIQDVERDCLGSGGMGSVYLATDLTTQSKVAIKVLKSDVVSAHPAVVERFVREGEALRKLNHPNIVKMLGRFEDAGEHALLLEYVEGGSLRGQLERAGGPLSLQQSLSIALDLTDALTRAHRLRIVHRDIKPENVLLALDGSARLTDFGIASFSQTGRGTRHLTAPDSVLGTAAYLSPEACLGEHAHPLTDIWSMGILMFEMLSGVLPFERSSMTGTLMAILNDPLPDLQALRPESPENLVDLVYRMLDKNKATRISSIRACGAELKSISLELGAAESSASNIEASSENTTGLLSAEALLPRPIAEPVRIAETGIGVHDSASNVGALPTPATRFIGRTEDLRRVHGLLNDAGCRLVTLMGPGGIGKSRLALEIARQRSPTDGAFFVALAPVTDSGDVISCIAEVVGLNFSGPTPPPVQLCGFLASKDVLLVLDNFEHVVDAASLLQELLEKTDRLQLLVTSCTRLQLPAEHVFELDSMPFPKHGESVGFEAFDAIQLFTAYARRVQPGYVMASEDRAAVARICTLVGGIPLALELAAAWVRLMPPSEIAKELERDLDLLESPMHDASDHHRSTRAAFWYSWKLLSPAERAVCSALSVFRGGFTREAARAVTRASLRLLLGLVDQSIVKRDARGRFEMHELIRQYAEEQLLEQRQQYDDAMDAHARHYASELVRLDKAMRQGEPTDDIEIIAILDREAGNLRQAMRRWMATFKNTSVRLGPLSELISELTSSMERRGIERARGTTRTYPEVMRALIEEMG